MTTKAQARRDALEVWWDRGPWPCVILAVDPGKAAGAAVFRSGPGGLELLEAMAVDTFTGGRVLESIVKRAFDEACDNHLEEERLLAARQQLSICEGSDWFWWFGDYNPAESVSDFDRLFRMHLGNLYQLLGRSPPEYLSHSFTHGSGSPERGGVMRHGQDQQ